jgi:hypothetical protein
MTTPVVSASKSRSIWSFLEVEVPEDLSTISGFRPRPTARRCHSPKNQKGWSLFLG